MVIVMYSCMHDAAGIELHFVLQGVHMLAEFGPGRPWKPDEKRYSKLVFIGRDLDKKLLREGFEECLLA